MIVAQQVQQAVQRQHANFGLNLVPGLFRLAFRHTVCDDDIAEKSAALCGNDSTSGTASLPRNWRLRARMRRSTRSRRNRSPRADGGRNLHEPRPEPPCCQSLPRRRASGLATLTCRRATAISVVGLHDSLDELMTDHVALVEIDERNSINFADDFHRLH